MDANQCDMTERIAENVHRLRTKSTTLLFVSDVHYDSVHCDRQLLKKHLDEIKSAGGYVVCVGDWFDVMGCHKDPRTKMQDIREDYIVKGRSYLDLVIEDSAEFLRPYADNIALMAYGNHETAITKHRDTDPLDRLLYHLGPQVGKGAYEGWLQLLLERSGAGNTLAYNVAYHHGKGAGAPRSKGVLWSDIDAKVYPDADIIVSGHTHQKIWDPSNVRHRINRYGHTYSDCVNWLKTGAYKQTPTGYGYEVEKGLRPSRLGGWFCKLERKHAKKGNKWEEWIDTIIWEAT